jgi:hypothetical protein
MDVKIRTAMLVVAALILGGCASAPGGSEIAMPMPSPGDTEGQIMAVTGAGFTICGISDDGPDRYDVTVCGSVARVRAVLDGRFPGRTVLHAYQPGDGGSHTPQDLVMQFWVDRATGPGFVVSSSRITDNGKIDVGVDGDLDAARAVLNREFPGRIEVHAQPVSAPL